MLPALDSGRLRQCASGPKRELALTRRSHTQRSSGGIEPDAFKLPASSVAMYQAEPRKRACEASSGVTRMVAPFAWRLLQNSASQTPDGDDVSGRVQSMAEKLGP